MKQKWEYVWVGWDEPIIEKMGSDGMGFSDIINGINGIFKYYFFRYYELIRQN